MNTNNYHIGCNLEEVCFGIPKAELHIHIEGTFEPELMFEIAQRNNIQLPYKSVEEIKEKYNFRDLQEFLDIYYKGCEVLLTETDFEDLMYAYLKKASSQGCKYSEVFFDPQSHIPRGVSFETLINGLKRGIQRGNEDFNIEVNLIMCFLRHLSEESALETFQQATPYLDDILAIGLDSSELGNPPDKFKNVYKLAKEKGLRLCAHGGEEGDVDTYVKTAIEINKIERLDHGVRIIEDPEYMKVIAEKKIPLTLCPLSNLKLQVYPDLRDYPIRTLLDAGVLCMLNSDDPAYFCGYIGDNYVAVMKNSQLTLDEIILLAKNSFNATFLPEEKKIFYLDNVDKYIQSLKI